MGLSGDEYVIPDVSTIRDGILEEFQAEHPEDLDVAEGSVWYTIADSFAESIVTNQENAIRDVYNAAFLESATGGNLEKVLDIVGINRLAAQSGRGYVRFDHGSAVTQDYDIGDGTLVSTGGTNPITFETTQATQLSLHDNFEDNDISEYNGDTGSFSTQSGTALSGTYSLQGNGSDVAIALNGATSQRGDKTHCLVQATAGGVASFLFCTADADNTYRLTIDEPNDDVLLEKVDGGTTSTLDSQSVTVSPGTQYEFVAIPKVQGDVSGELLDSGGSTIASVSATDNTFTGGTLGFRADGSSDVFFDDVADEYTSVEIVATDSGPNANVAANSVTSLPNPISGVSQVNNPVPVGDPDFDLPDGTLQVSGTTEESDEDLRQRARETVTQGGEGTANAILGSILPLDDVRSVTVVVNKEDTAGITSPSGFSGNNLPAHSFELIVLGGDSEEIARTLYETKGITDNDEGGTNGTLVTETVESDVNGQEFDVTFTRPNEVDIDLTLDLTVTDGQFTGKDDIKDDIVDYIGGTNVAGEQVDGLDADEDVVLDQITDRVVGDDNGVIGVQGDPTVDSPTTTTKNGLTVVDIQSNEVASTDATDGSLTINVTTV